MYHMLHLSLCILSNYPIMIYHVINLLYYYFFFKYSNSFCFYVIWVRWKKKWCISFYQKRQSHYSSLIEIYFVTEGIDEWHVAKENKRMVVLALGQPHTCRILLVYTLREPVHVSCPSQIPPPFSLHTSYLLSI